VMAKHGAINTPEASHDLRTVDGAFHPEQKKLMLFMGFSVDEQVIPFIF